MKHTEDVWKQIEEVNELVAQLVPEVRDTAFRILLSESGVTWHTQGEPGTSVDREAEVADAADAADFFTSLETTKPSEAALAVAAYYYLQYGKSPLTAAKAKEVAAQVGLIVPDHIYMTYKSAQREGKKLFSRGKDGFIPTVHGEKFFRDTYKVKKGTLSLPVEDAA